MIIKDVMTKNVISVHEDASIMKAGKIMKENRIRRLPVVKNGRLVGLITERILLEVSPSPATSLSVYEINYLLDKLTVKDVMVKNPVTIPSDMPVNEALRLGREKGYGVFPVVDEGIMVGIITETDIVNFMARLLGLKEEDDREHLEKAGAVPKSKMPQYGCTME